MWICWGGELELWFYVMILFPSVSKLVNKNLWPKTNQSCFLLAVHFFSFISHGRSLAQGELQSYPDFFACWNVWIAVFWLLEWSLMLGVVAFVCFHLKSWYSIGLSVCDETRRKLQMLHMNEEESFRTHACKKFKKLHFTPFSFHLCYKGPLTF